MSAPETQVRAEIEARHAFFVAWFTGRAGEPEFETCAAAFAPDMRRIGPEGAVQDRDAILAMLRSACGRHSEPFSIAIEFEAAVDFGPDTVLQPYVERQSIGARRTARRSTALFTRSATAPLGWLWRHLHETWTTCDQAGGSPAPNMERRS